MMIIEATRIDTGMPVLVTMEDHGLKPDGTVYVSSWEFDGKVLISEYPSLLPHTAARRFGWDLLLLKQAGIDMLRHRIVKEHSARVRNLNAAPQANKGSITGSPVPCPAVAAPE